MIAYDELKSILLEVTERTYHLEAPENTEGRYVVWTELSPNEMYGDNSIQEIVYRAQIDVYSPEELDTLPFDIWNAIQAKDNMACTSPNPTWDADRQMMRWVLQVEVI